MPDNKGKKTYEQEKIIQPRVTVKLDTSGMKKTVPVQPEPVTPLDQGSTPITQNDYEIMRSGTSPYSAESNAVAPPPPATPYPEPGAGAIMAGMFSGIPFIGPFASKPITDIQRKKEDMIKKDIGALEFFDAIMKENPRQAGTLIKSPMFRDAMLRQKGATDDDIADISKVLSDPKLSVNEQISILSARGMTDEKGNIVPQPFAVEKEKQMEREDQDKFVKAAMAANKDWSEFDALMGWYAAGRKGATTKGFDMKIPANSDEALIVNKDNGSVSRVSIKKAKKYTIYPMVSEEGFEAMIWVDPTDPTGKYGVMSADTIFANSGIPPEDLARIIADPRTYWERIKAQLLKLYPWAADQIQNIPITAEGAAGMEEVNLPEGASLPPGTTYAGPAKNQEPQKSAAEIEADSKY